MPATSPPGCDTSVPPRLTATAEGWPTTARAGAGGVVSYRRARATAAVMSTIPAPVFWFQPLPTVWWADRRRTSPVCSAVRRALAPRTSAAAPDTRGAEKLVPSP